MPDWGIPYLGLGYPPEGTWDQSHGIPSGTDMGPVEVLWYGDGVPLPPGVNRLKTQPPVVLRTRAVIIHFFK